MDIRLAATLECARSNESPWIRWALQRTTDYSEPICSPKARLQRDPRDLTTVIDPSCTLKRGSSNKVQSTKVHGTSVTRQRSGKFRNSVLQVGMKVADFSI